MNISQLAEHLGLAVSTVSRVLSGNAEKYRISQQTADRIREAAARYRVVPDPLGSNLRKGKTGMIGLLVPDITNPFFAHLARAIELHLRTSGIAVQLCDSAEDADTEVALLENLLQRRLDGLIVAPVGIESEALTSALLSSPMPIVLMDRVISGIPLSSVCLDNFSAGRLAAISLLEAGHRHLGCLRGDPESIADQDRLAGVEDAIHERGSPVELRVEGTGYSLAESLATARNLLSPEGRPTAILTLSGQGILGVLDQAAECGIRIPDDISVLAFDEQPWSRLISPPVATIAQPVEEMATRAAELLLERLEDADRETEPVRLVFDAVLHRRASIGAPRD